jgi:hypothetical protein
MFEKCRLPKKKKPKKNSLLPRIFHGRPQPLLGSHTPTVKSLDTENNPPFNYNGIFL